MTRKQEAFNAESALIGAVLVDNGVFDEVADIVQPKDFEHGLYQDIWAAYQDMAHAGIPMDPLTVSDRIGRAQELLEDLQATVGTTVNSRYHAVMVKNGSTRRAGAKAADKVAAMFRNKDVTTEDAIEYGQEQMLGLALARDSRPQSGAVAAFAEAESARKRGGGPAGLFTGYSVLDRMTSGLRAGNLIVLAARPGMGKTALATNIATKCAKAGHSVGFFSMEMGRRELWWRILASEAQVDGRKLRDGTLCSRHWQQAKAAFHACQNWADRLYVESGAQTIYSIKAQCRRWLKHGGLDLIVVDYLQLVRHHDRKIDRDEYVRVSELSAAFKGAAIEFKRPIILLSQLNRNLESRRDPLPILSDLRSSGTIEQDADIVLFIHKEGETAWLKMAKQRSGPVGTFNLEYKEEWTLFRDLTERDQGVPAGAEYEAAMKGENDA